MLHAVVVKDARSLCVVLGGLLNVSADYIEQMVASHQDWWCALCMHLHSCSISVTTMRWRPLLVIVCCALRKVADRY